MITVENLSFAYENEQVLKNVSCSFDEGTINVIIGASGCGKTTFCRCICGVIPTSVQGSFEGRIQIFGEDISGKSIPEIGRTVGYVMQEPDHQIVATTVEDDLAFGPENMRVAPSEIRERISEAAHEAGVPVDFFLRNPMKLSGGEKKRVAIAGVLAMNPKILLFDEPFSNMDKAGKRSLLAVFRKLKSLGKTLIIVEHDFMQLDFADKWIVMDKGKLTLDGLPKNVKELLGESLWH